MSQPITLIKHRQCLFFERYKKNVSLHETNITLMQIPTVVPMNLCVYTSSHVLSMPLHRLRADKIQSMSNTKPSKLTHPLPPIMAEDFTPTERPQRRITNRKTTKFRNQKVNHANVAETDSQQVQLRPCSAILYNALFMG